MPAATRCQHLSDTFDWLSATRVHVQAGGNLDIAICDIKMTRGRPKSDSEKVLVSTRYSPEVVDFFKASGQGWQSRMDAVLRQYVARRSSRV